MTDEKWAAAAGGQKITRPSERNGSRQSDKRRRRRGDFLALGGVPSNVTMPIVRFIVVMGRA